MDFCILMSFQVKVGVPLLQALDVAQQDCDKPALREVLSGVQRQIEAGLLLYEALERYPRVFTPHFVSVIRAGEMSSKLPEAFTDLHDYLEWVDRVSAEVRQASLYPGIILSVVSLFVAGSSFSSCPKFAALLNVRARPTAAVDAAHFRGQPISKGKLVGLAAHPAGDGRWDLAGPSLFAARGLVVRPAQIETADFR